MNSLRKLCFVLTLLTACLYSHAQTAVSGTVTDSAGRGIAGINVLVKGTTRGVSTKADGSFSILAPANGTLLFSGVGYGTREVPVNGQTSIAVSLSEKQNELNTVVVTALGISKENRKLGYAVTTVGGDQLDKARETNVALSLAGEVAGLNVHGANGGPGSSARILIRGMSSMNSGGSPLFVINGVPMDNSVRGSANEWGGADLGDGIGNINPDDIESMTVLKGQAASALYGARASNGVILITTKKGKKGDYSVEFNTNNVWDRTINNTDYQYEYGQGLEGAKPANATATLNSDRFAWGAKMDGSSIPGPAGFSATTVPYSPYKNNINNVYRTGPTNTNTIAFSGGGDRGTFRLSASNLDNSSVIRNSGIDRKTFNFNFDQKLSDKLSVTLIANYIDEQDRNRPYLSDGPLNVNNFLFLAPNINANLFKPGFDANGNELVFSDDNYVTNPWFAFAKFVNNTARKRIITSTSAKYNFNSWVYAMVRLGYDNENDRYLNVTPSGTNYSFNSAGQSGSISLSNAQTSELNIDGIVGVRHALTKDIGLDATLGVNSRRNNFESIGISGGPFVVPGLYTPSNVVSFGRSYGYDEKEVHSGYYTVDLSYKNFLTLNTTGRYDAYSTLYNSGLPKDKRDIFTPSVSAGFVFSELLHSKKLSFGKLRASYAQTSGEPGNAYQTAVYYSVGNAINGVPTGNFSSTLPNLFLKPFTLTEAEVGAELKFFDNRLGLDVAYFSRQSHHEIIGAGISQATGYSSTVIGSGATQNRGLEVLLTGTPVKTTNFTWNVSFNITSVSNKILATDASGNNISLGNYRPLNANTAYVKGLSGPQIMAHDYTYDSKGQIEVDGSGLPIQGALKPFGGVLPTLYGGLKNDFSYKHFNLSFLIDYNYGNKILSATSYYTIYRGLNKLTLAGRDNGITTGVTTAGAANTVTATAQDYYQRLSTISRVNVLNGDFIKLRQVTLGYTISERQLGNIPIFRSIQISLVGRNLWTIMKKSDNIDPENNFATGVNYAGIEGTSLPATRTYGINANFKFKK